MNEEELFYLLAKYIDHVGQHEGVVFLSERDRGCFSEKEWEILKKAEDLKLVRTNIG